MLLSLFIYINAAASTDSDSIKPLPQINKDFLVVVHIVRNQSGAAGIAEATIRNVMNQVSSIFKPINANFVICEFKYIDNFQYNDMIFQETISKRKKELDPLYRLEHRINMFFINDPDVLEKKTCGYASSGGIADYGNIVIKKSCTDVGTIAHEVGHYFGLGHTFEKNGIAELANGSNCSIAGDKFCDTPADPYVEGTSIDDYIDVCVFKSLLRDSNGDTYAPDVSNIMSYYTSCICLTFSYEQYQSMANYYLSHTSTW